MKFLIYIICILCSIIRVAVCDNVNQNNKKNVFILIGIDSNQIHQLIKTCLIEDANALRILVVDEDGLRDDNTTHLVRECHYKKHHQSTPQHYCVHAIIELKEEFGLSFRINLALEYLKKSIINVKHGVAVLTVPGIFSCRRSHVRCHSSIFDVVDQGSKNNSHKYGRNKNIQQPSLEIIPFAFENIHGSKFDSYYNAKHDRRSLITTPSILLNKAFVKSNIRFDLQYTSIGAYYAIGAYMLSFYKHNSFHISKTRKMIPMSWGGGQPIQERILIPMNSFKNILHCDNMTLICFIY
jgi:hypothetical protein